MEGQRLLRSGRAQAGYGALARGRTIPFVSPDLFSSCTCTQADLRRAERPAPLAFDRVSRSTSGTQAILYFDPYSPESSSADLLNYLDEHAAVDSDFSFIVRYRTSQIPERVQRKTKLSGYGVELALKKTDYLVVDDRESGPAGRASDESTEAGGNASLAGVSFSEALGEDPWSELSTPLTKIEVLGT